MSNAGFRGQADQDEWIWNSFHEKMRIGALDQVFVEKFGNLVSPLTGNPLMFTVD